MHAARLSGLAVVLVAAGLSAACSASPPATRPSGAAAAGTSTSGAAPAAALFTDVAREVGLDFVHVNGMSGGLSIAEIIGPGVALFDYDNDGDLDVYAVQGQPLDRAAPPSRGATPLTDRLFRNDLTVAENGRRTLRFTDVTAASRIVPRGYGMGVAAADVNNDGWTDLYLTKFNAPAQLLRNEGNGTFSEVAGAGGADVRDWSVSAAFADLDRDGWLDLVVGRYIRYTLDGISPCRSAAGVADYCMPAGYPTQPPSLFRNTGRGRFADVTASARIAGAYGPALGVVAADFDGDGWTDLYVANDGQENQLWINRHDGTFDNRALLAGVALPVTGKAEGSMGVDAGDVDDDGDLDLVVTELATEGANLFLNDGRGTFDDASASSGVGAGSAPFTGFGAGWLDYDNDGRLDLLIVNGTVQTIDTQRRAGDPLPLRQRRLLFRNEGGGRFSEIGARAGAAFQVLEVGRGAAFGDVDNDGAVDVLIGQNNGPLSLLMNRAAAGRHWVGLRLVGGEGRRDLLGAVVEVRTATGVRLRRAHTDGSFASSNDPRVHVGLGDVAAPVDVVVRWPDGRAETFSQVPVDRYTTLVQGTGP